MKQWFRLGCLIAIASTCVGASSTCAIPFSGYHDASADLCAWLQDPNNCYRAFGKELLIDDLGDPQPARCTQLSGSANAVPQVGEFSESASLTTCILREGGIIKFDQPIDPTKEPPGEVSFRFLNADLSECGTVDWLSSANFTITINGSRTEMSGTPNSKAARGGTLKVTPTATQPSGANETVSCPNGETHNFDALEVQKCTAFDALQPKAVVSVVAGGLDPEGLPGGAYGAVKFSLFIPPTTGDLTNATLTEIKYFTCLIPPPSPVCANNIQDPGETDVDCGGTFCQKRCATNQKCITPSDCISQACEQVMGTNRCVSPATTSSGGGGGAGGGGGGGAGGA